ncbi:MAG: BON domain-containing protein [Vitreoscilla sp.]|nr:BON domain-containing protein [Vitreoscilla sp.]
MLNRRTTLVTAGLATTLALSACAPLLVGGAALSGALMYSDRRTSGAQVEDQAIEFKAGPKVRSVLGERGHVNVTSYNRMVLITGEVPAEADRATVDQAVASIENVRSTVNETAVMGAASLTARSNDSIISGKVKAALVDDGEIQATAIKVVTERAVVYLMGRVTEREAAKAAQVASAVSGVSKVVRVFEIITEAELQAWQAKH